MHNEKWILISDSCRARIFLDRGLQNGLEEIGGYAYPGGREHVRDRVSDRAGMKPAGAQGVRAGASQEVDPREAQSQAFARFLAGTLKKKKDQHAFQELVIAAPPHLLGILRDAMDDTVARCIVASLDKDYVALDRRELGRRIHAAMH